MAKPKLQLRSYYEDYGGGWKNLKADGWRSYPMYCEAMILVEIGEPSPRTALFELGENEEELRANLDLLQEAREIAHIREYAMKARVARKYDRGVIPRNFEAGDLVLKKVTQKIEKNKLTPCWEGPFRVIEEASQEAYRLENLARKKLPRAWNAASLRMYYS
ncbi:hypothetical protein CR513_60966, partial [Mucuna pruriens]